MRKTLTIGEFSKITHLSVRTLRRYHEAGLLEPDQVDPDTGYRYYTTAQVPTAQIIRRFRDLGMPLREIDEVLATDAPATRHTLIAGHLARLENQLDRTCAAITSLRRLLEPAALPIEIELRAVPATTVAAIRATLDLHEVLAWYDGAMTELEQALRAHAQEPTGPCGGLYDNELFTAEHGDAVVFIPVAEPPTTGRVHPVVLPAVELAVTVHRGPHDDIDISYGALGTYVTEHAFAIAGPVRETYLVGPRDTGEAAAWRTEIGWPIFRTSAA